MAVTVKCETAKGGAVELNKAHGAWASYAVATAGDAPPAELFYAGVKLPGGRAVQLFVNRETGLVVVEVADKTGLSGTELLRTVVKGEVRGRKWVAQSLEAPGPVE